MTQPRWDPHGQRWLLDEDALAPHRHRRPAVGVAERPDGSDVSDPAVPRHAAASFSVADLTQMGFDVPGTLSGGLREAVRRPVDATGDRPRPRPEPGPGAPGEVTGRHGTDRRVLPVPGPGHDDRNGRGHDTAGYHRDEHDRDGHGPGEPTRHGSGIPDGYGRGNGRAGYDRDDREPGDDVPNVYAPDTGYGGNDRAGRGRADDRDGYDRDGYDRDGYDRDGYDRDGYDRDGYHREDHDGQYYDQDGYDLDDGRDGDDDRDRYYDYDPRGDDTTGYDRGDHDPSEYDPEPWSASGHAGPATTRLRRSRAAFPDGGYADTGHVDADDADTGDAGGPGRPAGRGRRRRAVPTRVRRRRWPWVVGGVALLGVVAVVVALVVPGLFQDSSAPAGGVASLDPSGASTGNGAAPAPGGDAPLPAGAQVTYEVTGAGTARTITFGRGTGVNQVSDAPLPWQQVQPVVEGAAEYTISAQTGGGSGEISCRITVDGAVIAEDKADGEYAAVSCTGRR